MHRYDFAIQAASYAIGQVMMRAAGGGEVEATAAAMVEKEALCNQDTRSGIWMRREDVGVHSTAATGGGLPSRTKRACVGAVRWGRK